MQERRSAVKKGCSKEGMRKGGILDCRVQGYRKKGIWDWQDSGLEGYRKKGFRTGGIQERRDSRILQI